MRSMTARDAKNPFGELLMEAQREPVTIEKNGKPVAVVRSYEDDQEIERMKLEWLRRAVAEGIAAADRGEEEEWTEELTERIIAEAEAERAAKVG